MNKIIGLALAVALAAAACGGDDESADESACAAVEDVTHAMETDARTVDGAIDELISAASDADDQRLQEAGADLERAMNDPAQNDEFGAGLASLMDRCDELAG